MLGSLCCHMVRGHIGNQAVALAVDDRPYNIDPFPLLYEGSDRPERPFFLVADKVRVQG